MYLVTGATAHFGRQAVETLLDAGHPVRALSRTPEKAGLPEGVEVVRGDLTRPETLPPALDGVKTILLSLQFGMSPVALLEAAKQAGVQRIVFLSSGAVVDGAERQGDVIARYFAEVEAAIAASGIEWTVLRLFFPAINSLTFAMQLQGGDTIRAPYAGAAVSAIHEQDVADVAVRTLTDDAGHAGEIYTLTGPQSLTQADQVRVLGEGLGRALSFEELDPEPVLEQMSQFMDPAFLQALFALMAATVGKPCEVNDTVERLTGHPARTYAQWVADHKADFS